MSIQPPNADVYAWVGGPGGTWGLAGNWQDLTSGANPALVAPGSLTPVTIVGLSAANSTAISGGGVSASLSLTGNATLSGAYATGLLSVGKRSAVAGGSSSVNYVYGAGALVVTTSLSTGAVSLVSGSLGLTGSGTSFVASGSIGVGSQGSVTGGPPASYDPGAAAAIAVGAGTIFTAAGTLTVAQGSIAVGGTGASASVAAAVTLGAAGVPAVIGSPYSFDSAGSVAVSAGGVFAAGDTLTEIAGSVTVDGTGSRLTVQNLLTLGLAATTGYGTWSLGVTSGGSVRAGGILVQAPATSNPGSAGTTPPALLVDATSSIEVGSGSAAAGTITIDAGRTLASITSATISGAVIDNGVLSEAGGNLVLLGSLSGSGSLLIGSNGSVTLDGTAGAGVAITFATSTGSLVVGTGTGGPYTIGGAISGFQLGDSLAVGVAATSVAYAAASASTGTLTLLNGSTLVASFSLVGSYTPGAFVLSPTLTGGAVVTLLAPQTGSGGTQAQNADAYAWSGSTGGYWGVTTNWLDLTSPGNTGQFVPGSQTPVTIGGPSGPVYEVIRGGGSSASLALAGNVDLSGFYMTGALSLGARIAEGGGGSSVSYFYAPAASIVASVVTAGMVTALSGRLGVAGTGATLAVAGLFTVGSQSGGGSGPPASYDPGSSATVSVVAGATLTDAGALAITQGAMSVSGAGANATVSGTVGIGAAGVPVAGASPYSYDSIGMIAVAAGGLFSAGGALTEAVGSVSVDGVGSRLSVVGAMTLGLGSGGSSLAVTHGGSVQAATLVIAAPATRNPGAAVISAPSIVVDASGSVEIGSGGAAAGTITVDAGRSIASSTAGTITGSIVDNGTLSATGGNLALAGAVSGTGTLQIGAVGSVTLGGAVASGVGVVFTDATGALIVGTNTATGLPYGMAGGISGFRIGDTIAFGVNATGFSYVATSANVGTLTLLNGSAALATLTMVGNYTPRSFTFAAIGGGGSSIGLQAVPAGITASDFNADGHSDIVWQNDDGTPAIWDMNGLSYIGGATLGNPGPSWHIKAVGDFNGDGFADILWQNDNGTPAIWEMRGMTYIGGATLANPGIGWHVVATGDFNGDGKSDILWQNVDGTPAIWEMNGLSYIGGATLGNPGASWHVKATGDFNGDGRADILFQNDNGSVAIWEMNGLNVIGSAVIANPGPSWHVEGSGDFNGDGRADILFQSDNGSVAIWEMNGLNYIAGAVIANPGPTWHVKGTGDYNGDGRADILFQNDNGSVAIWEMNGLNYLGGAVLTNPGTSWHTIGSDGMLFINGTTGNGTLTATPAQDDMFVFTSFAAGAHAISGFNPARDLIELSVANFAGFAAVQASSSLSGGGTLIALGSNSSLLIQGVVPGSLTASDFRFV